MKTLYLTLLISCSTFTYAQTSRDEILKTVTNLFDAMKAGDSAQAHSCFGKNAIFNTVEKDKTGKTFLNITQLPRFLNAIGTAHKEEWNEVMWNPTVLQDGDLAEVWANYAFYIGKTFSHCGVDAFQLVKEETGWKIVHLNYTRKKDDCGIPKEISDRFK